MTLAVMSMFHLLRFQNGRFQKETGSGFADRALMAPVLQTNWFQQDGTRAGQGQYIAQRASISIDAARGPRTSAQKL